MDVTNRTGRTGVDVQNSQSGYDELTNMSLCHNLGGKLIPRLVEEGIWYQIFRRRRILNIFRNTSMDCCIFLTVLFYSRY